MKTQTPRPRRSRRNRGFTLIELLVVVLIIGILASIAVPQYLRLIERGRVVESTQCFQTIKGAQERYLLKSSNGQYAAAYGSLDVPCLPSGGAFKYFGNPTISGASATAYTATMQRTTANTPFGQYTMSFVGPTGTMTCTGTSNCDELLP